MLFSTLNDAPFFIYSSNEDICTVDSDGNIYAKSVGTTSVVINVEKYISLNCYVTVYDFQIPKEEGIHRKGDSEYISCKGIYGEQYQVTSNNENVVVVRKNGSSYEMKVVGSGTATLTYTCGDYSATRKISVALGVVDAIKQRNYQGYNDNERQTLQAVRWVIDRTTSSGMSTSQKVKAIHDYLVLNCDYDYYVLNNGTISNESYGYYGVYGCQCVDLIKYYYAYFGYANYAMGNANAYISNNLPPGLTRVYSNYQPGDIAVWKTNHSCSTCGTTSLGHVGIITSADSVGFNAVNQNFSNQSFCSRNWFYCSALACAIRPSYSGGTTVAPSPSVTFADFNQNRVWDTNAEMYIKVMNPNRGRVSAVGCYLYNANGGLIKSYSESCNYTTSYVNYNCNFNNDMKYSLTPGTSYQFELYAIVDGREYKDTRRSPPMDRMILFQIGCLIPEHPVPCPMDIGFMKLKLLNTTMSWENTLPIYMPLTKLAILLVLPCRLRYRPCMTIW